MCIAHGGGRLENLNVFSLSNGLERILHCYCVWFLLLLLQLTVYLPLLLSFLLSLLYVFCTLNLSLRFGRRVRALSRFY
jgi:hypothetical protein